MKKLLTSTCIKAVALLFVLFISNVTTAQVVILQQGFDSTSGSHDDGTWTTVSQIQNGGNDWTSNGGNSNDIIEGNKSCSGWSDCYDKTGNTYGITGGASGFKGTGTNIGYSTSTNSTYFSIFNDYDASFNSYGGIISPMFNLSNYTNATLTFYWNNANTTDSYIEVEYYNGTTWVWNGNYYGEGTGSLGWHETTMSLPSNATQLVFFVISDYEYYAIGLDQIEIYGTSCTTPSATITSSTNVNCYGQSTGSATVSTNGTSPTYSWAPTGYTGGTTTTYSALPAGTYTVTVTANAGCTNTATVNITQSGTALSASISSGNVSPCSISTNGTATVTASGGTTPYTYSWTPSSGITGATTTTAGSLSETNYTCTVTDNKGCTTSHGVTIGGPAQVTGSITHQTNILCYGASTGAATISGSGGTSPYTYSWTPTTGVTGATTSSPSTMIAGTYTCTITDHNGCTGTTTVSITQPSSVPSATISGTNAACYGDEGSATVNATGGTPSYSYSWSGGHGHNATESLNPGTYTCTVTDNNGCSVTPSPIVTITQPAEFGGTINTYNICGSGTGQIGVDLTGGTPPYTYSWHPNITSTDTAYGLASGSSYTITVNDANNCGPLDGNTTIETITAETVSITSSANEGCYGGNSGSATALGSPTHAYVWEPGGSTSATITGLASGIYTVVATETDECTATATVNITQPTVITPTITYTNTCSGSTNGSASVSVIGGTSPYTYSWNTSPAQTTTSISGLAAGNYTVTITDHNSCIQTASVTITVNTLPNIAITSTQSIYNVTGIDTLTVTGANSYLWNNGSTNNIISVTPSSGLSEYTVIGTGANGCLGSDTIDIRQLIFYSPFGDTNMVAADSNYRNTHVASPSDTLEGGGDAMFKQWQSFWDKRLPSNGSFSSYAHTLAQYYSNAHQSNNLCGASTMAGTWTELGPNKNGVTGAGTGYSLVGRANIVTIDPNNLSNMYVGGADGGVFQSTNSGAQWNNMGSDAQFVTLGVSDILVEPTTVSKSDVVYVATGDAQNGFSFSDGVYRCTNASAGGNNVIWTNSWPWPLNDYTNQNYIYKLAVDPNDTKMLYAASDFGIVFANNRDGYAKNTPLNWYTDIKSPQPCFSIATTTVNTNITNFYASGYDIYAGKGTENTNTGGVKWTKITGPNTGTGTLGAGGLDLTTITVPGDCGLVLNTPTEPYNGMYLLKIFLTASPDGKYIYANIFTALVSCPINYRTVLQWVARYNTSIKEWDVNPPSNEPTNYINTGGNIYSPSHSSLIVDNSDPTYSTIYAGTTDLVKSIDGGVSWVDISGYAQPHPDYHCIIQSPTNSNIIYTATDGGMASFDVSNKNVTELDNGLGIQLTWDAEASEQNPSEILAGDWDNGTQITTSTSTNWNQDVWGDGDNVMIDYINNANLYGTNPEDFYALLGSSKGWGILDGKQLYDCDYSAPRVLDPFNSSTIYEGRDNVYKYTTASGWHNISDWSSFYSPIFKDWAQQNYVTYAMGSGKYRLAEAMTICSSNPNYIFVTLKGDNDAYPQTATLNDYFRLAWTTDGAAGQNGTVIPTFDWLDATPDNSNQFISGVAMSYNEPSNPSPSDPLRVWITYSGLNTTSQQFSSNPSGYNVKYGTFDGNNWNWYLDGAALCNFNINCIVYEDGSNDGLYIGTDAGVYYKNASMSSWEKLGNNFPNVIVEHLKIDYCSHMLVAGTWGRGTWEIPLVPSTATPLELSANTTWSGDMFIHADVEIQSGVTLTIPSGTNVYMCANRKITVDRGAQLIIDGTITSECGALWAGIDLQGNSSEPQSNVSPTGQGQVIMNGGEIQYAANGITTIKTNPDLSWNWAYTGGIIQATNATFSDCSRDIQYLYYHDPAAGKNLSNKGSFVNCTFITDNQSLGNIQPDVTMYEVHGVTFRGCSFSNTIPLATQPVADYRGGGIYSIDASYSAIPICNSLNINNGTCNGTPTTFNGLGCAINATSSIGYSINVNQCGFTDNYTDMLLQGVDYANMVNNTFSKGPNAPISTLCSTCDPYSIYLDQCTGYIIKNNSFSAIVGYGLAGSDYGIIVNNSGVQNNLINDNSFSGLFAGIQAQGTNGLVQLTCYHPPCAPPLEIYTGLELQCNQFNSSITGGADISVTSGLINPVQGICTNAATTANNTFNDDCPSRLNIYGSNSLTWGIYYNTANVVGQIPYCSSLAEVYVNTCTNINSSLCGNIVYTNPNNLNTQFRAEKRAVDSLNQVLISGDSSSLYNIIQTGTSAQIQNTLLAAGPYLSDGVLSATIKHSDLPADTLRNILIPNSPLDSNIIDTLNTVRVPDYIREQINEAQNGSVSPRSEVSYDATYSQNQSDVAFLGLVNYYINDTTIGAPNDSALIFMQSIQSPTTFQLAKLASMQAIFGNYSQATNVLDTLVSRNDTNYTKLAQVLPVVMQLQQDSNHFSTLQSESANAQILGSLANSTSPGYANARTVLQYALGNTYTQPIEPIIYSGNGHKPVHNNGLANNSNNNAVNDQFKLYPNPANDRLTIQYGTDSTNSSMNIKLNIYSVTGNMIISWVLPSDQNQVTEDISSLAPGFYLYSMSCDNRLAQRGKFVIAR